MNNILSQLLRKSVQSNSMNYLTEFMLNNHGSVTFVNSYSYLLLRKRTQILGKIDFVFYDGIFIVYFIKLFLRLDVIRMSFDMSSVAKHFFELLNNNGRSVYVIGTTHESITRAIENLRSRYSSVNIVGFRNGFFKDKDDMEAVIISILELNPNYVVVGMGTPLQEVFLNHLKDKGWKGLGFSCGGFLHQTANRLDYYPHLIDRLHLRWAYRLFDEPKLIKRFILNYSIFPIVFIGDWLGWIRSKK